MNKETTDQCTASVRTQVLLEGFDTKLENIQIIQIIQIIEEVAVDKKGTYEHFQQLRFHLKRGYSEG